MLDYWQILRENAPFHRKFYFATLPSPNSSPGPTKTHIAIHTPRPHTSHIATPRRRREDAPSDQLHELRPHVARPHADEEACKTHAPRKKHTPLWARVATCVWLKTHASEIRGISRRIPRRITFINELRNQKLLGRKKREANSDASQELPSSCPEV
ncbi:hypothetical protein L596_000350 [Steinernema carpocapsae]|uniref:Uncharacterized protein n=1 Tax=Steinernema carpocapsae TaxID=34508 RepID=A0A4U8UHW4_STECR|nr:hypothetical protein L596_000350 [Steinernema carpocapsae]